MFAVERDPRLQAEDHTRIATTGCAFHWMKSRSRSRAHASRSNVVVRKATNMRWTVTAIAS